MSECAGALVNLSEASWARGETFVNISSSISCPDSSVEQRGLLGDTAARDYAQKLHLFNLAIRTIA
jgi:hypothetical protein